MPDSANPMSHAPSRGTSPGVGDAGRAAEGQTGITLQSIHVYPVKGAAGIALDAADLDATGLRHDRRWMVVDPDGRFLSQRQVSRLCLVKPRFDEDALVLSAPGMADVAVPLRPEDGTRRDVRVWSDDVPAVVLGGEVRDWLTDFLAKDVGGPLDLAYFPIDSERQVRQDFGRPGDRVAFADAFPFLLIGEGSLEDLNQRLVARGAEAIPMNRFRPNLVLSGTAPYEEDGWRQVRIGDVPFQVVKAAGRCVVTTTDQATGEVGTEPLATLNTYRREGKAVLFGQYLVHDGGGMVRVGDEVVALGAV
ncbi:MAG: MOSC domain-containing protein [Trueperaceae bacterium]